MVTFVRTNHRYQPYDDFFALAGVSGYEVITVDKLDPEKNETYIITPANGEWIDGWQNPKAQIIWWDLEWGGYLAPQPLPAGVSRVWASCEHYARVSGAEFVRLAGVPFNPPPYTQRQFNWDIALMAYREPHRRAHVIRLINELGLSIAPDGWDEERANALIKSRLMVHIHQHDYNPSIAPLRFVMAGMAALPILSENVITAMGYDHYCTFSDYSALSHTAVELIRRPHLLERMSSEIYNATCIEHTFKGEVESHV